MEIRDLRDDEIEAARQLLCAHGWEHRVGTSEEFARLIARSQRSAVAIVDAQLVGFARAITDGISNGYLSMVVVAPEYRRRGIGRALLAHIMGDDPKITWVLRAGREGEAGFFTKLGFDTSTVAMERLRR
ncbi:MAG: GNAT family N-acetyltransferase [Planctomycetia bacterium]|nr:GNAT family N-acetyltransferase [Planctomycetia bacterium]